MTNGNRAILLTGLVLLLTLVVFDATPLDLLVQDRFYDPVTGWRVDRNAPLPRLIFYDGPKVVLGGLLAGLLTCIAAPASLAARLPYSRREAAFLLVCIGIMVGLVSELKNMTGVFPPFRLERYGGTQPHVPLFESFSHMRPRARGHSFPAAHCSGAFALMSLYFVGKRRAARWAGLGLGLAAGWTLGLYQMLKGAHFLSHTVVTMILAWLTILVVSRVFRLGGAPGTAAPFSLRSGR